MLLPYNPMDTVFSYKELCHRWNSRYPLQVSNKDGVWGLNITKVGHEDAGVYVCQTDDPDMGTVSVRLDIKGTVLYYR